MSAWCCEHHPPHDDGSLVPKSVCGRCQLPVRCSGSQGCFVHTQGVRSARARGLQKAWRKGYCAGTRWDRQPLKIGQSDSVVRRFERHESLSLPPIELPSPEGMKLVYHARQLVRRRSKWKRQSEAAKSRDPESDSSASCSSSIV